MLRMMVYNQALILVPTLYLSRLANALNSVSCTKSLADSLSRVSVKANGFKNVVLLMMSSLNSGVDILFNFIKSKLNKEKHPTISFV